MKTQIVNSKKITKIVLIGLLLISMASCGPFNYANRDDDSIYASSQPKERIVYIERPSQNNNDYTPENKTNYFLEQAKQFQDLNDKDVLVDIDSLSSNSNDNDVSYVNGAPWEYTDHTTVNIYTQPNYYGGYGYYNYYNPYFSTPYYGYYDYYNPYYSNYYYYPSAYIGFGFPFFGGYFSYNPYSGYYNPYYGNYYGGNYYGGRSYANYSKRVTYNTRTLKQNDFNTGYKRNSNNLSIKNGFINNASNKRNSTNIYSRNNNSNKNNNYNRNNTDKNSPVYKNNSNNNNSGKTRTNNSNNSGYKRNSGNSGGYKRNGNGNNQADIDTDNHSYQLAIQPGYKRNNGFINTVRRVVSAVNSNPNSSGNSSYKRNESNVSQPRTNATSGTYSNQYKRTENSNSNVNNSRNKTVSTDNKKYHRNNN